MVTQQKFSLNSLPLSSRNLPKSTTHILGLFKDVESFFIQVITIIALLCETWCTLVHCVGMRVSMNKISVMISGERRKVKQMSF